MKRFLKQSGLWWPVKWPAFALKTLLLFVFVAAFQACAVDEDVNPDDPIEKFLGTWHVSDQPGRINYVVTIERDPGHSSNVILRNFADMGSYATGLVVGNNIVLEKQEIDSSYYCSGTGTYNTKYQLTFNFILDDGIDIEQRKAIFTR
jgi:hypothetical protein